MGNKLYVGNLAYSVRDDSLMQAFSSFGTVTSAKVMMDRETGRSKGFGYLTTTEDVATELLKLTDCEMDGRTLRFDRGEKKAEKPARASFGGDGNAPSLTLMVRNLSYNVDNDMLQQHFENAVGCRVAMDRESGSSRG